MLSEPFLFFVSFDLSIITGVSIQPSGVYRLPQPGGSKVV